MSIYDLRNNINQWTNIEISIDNDNNNVLLFINGEKQNFQPGSNTTPGSDNTLTFNNGVQLTKDSDSKMFIGGNRNGNNKFTGKMDKISITNAKKTPASAKAQYEKLKTRPKNTMFNVAFDSKSRTISDSSRFKSTGKTVKESESSGITYVDDVANNRVAINVTGGDFIEMEPAASMNGDNLKNTTFSAWIKTPSGYNNSGYEPILSRNGIFSFGLNNGHASLFLGKDNQLVPGTNITSDITTSSTVVSSISSIMDSNTESLLFDANFNTNDASVTIPVAVEKKYSRIVPGSKYVELARTDKIELDRRKLIGKDLSSFTFSGWVNFASLNDDGIIFERPDAGLKLLADAAGRISVDYKVV